MDWKVDWTRNSSIYNTLLFSGHSHWQNIRHIKGAKDAEKQKQISILLGKLRSAVKSKYYSAERYIGYTSQGYQGKQGKWRKVIPDRKNTRNLKFWKQNTGKT